MGHKIAMVSDIHFGIRNNAENYLSMIEIFFLKTLRDVLENENIKDLRILGDVFDCRNTINVRTFNVVLKIFECYEKEHPDVSIKILLGNHDIYYKNRTDIHSLRILSRFKNVEIIEKMTEETLNGKKIIMFPWLIDGSTDKKQFDKICKGTKKYDLCLGHFEIQGFEISKGHYDDFGEKKGKFKNFNRVFTGHYHTRNTIGHITYLGCPYQLTWNDHGNTKGIHVYDVDENKTYFFENNLSPVFLEVKLSEIIKQEDLSQLEKNHVRLIIDKKFDETDILKTITRIETLAVAPRKLDIENQYVEVLDDEADVDLEKMNDPMNFLTDFIKNVEIPEDLEQLKLIEFIQGLYDKTLRESD